MINNVVLMGRLTADPELKYTTTEKAVLNFTIAVDKRRRDDGANFISCVAWEHTAKFINDFFGKGSMIAVTGEIDTRKYTDKDGNNRTAFEIIVREASFCGSKNEGGSAAPAAKPAAKPTAKPAEDFDILEEDDEDLPF